MFSTFIPNPVHSPAHSSYITAMLQVADE